MTKQILRVVAAGMLAGLALFLMPFILLRILAIFLIARVIFRLVGPRHWRRGYHFYPAFARRWQYMNDDEKKSFRDKMENDFFSKM
ncbi:MAG: hypothetical protein JWM28_2398 [Chitinophagaceae bacterium]|nr:hypothetical protein [Chitinophagaceae bacterium]